MTQTPDAVTSRRPTLWALAVVLAAAVLVARAGSAVHTFSSTTDEPYHIAAAVGLYEAHAHVMGVQHGPLSRWAAAVPLWAAGVRLPLPGADPHLVRSEAASFEFGSQVLCRGPVPYWRVLALSRWAMLLVFPPLCLFYVYRLGSLLAGRPVGAAAAVFFSLDPNLLGHAFWVCSDVAGCAGALASLYHGLVWLARPTGRTAAAAGVAAGLAVSCKFSCGLMLPVLAVLAGLDVGRALGGTRRWPTPGQVGVLAAAAFVALWATYLFHVGPLAEQDVFTRGLSRHLPRGLDRLPIPMPAFWIGLTYFIHHSQHGHASFLNGHVGQFGRWYYFPEAIALKEPIAVLLAVLLAGVVTAAVPSLRRRWRVAAAVLVPGGLFLATAMAGRLNLGIRHVLPVLPCLYLFACLPMAAVRRGWPAVLATLMLVAAVETVPQGPDYIAYFNRVAGGPAGGARYLLDSNLDWDQDAARLADWLRTSPVAAGRTYTVRLFDLNPRDLGDALGLRPGAVTDDPTGLFAVDLSTRDGLFGYVRRPNDTVGLGVADYRWLDRYRRVAHIGTSVDVYDLGSAATRPDR